MSKVPKAIFQTLWPVSLWLFIAIKVAGTSFAAWSWWWVLLPVVPLFSLFVQHYNL